MIKLLKKVLFSALDQAPTATLIVAAAQPGSPIVLANRAVEALLGRPADELRGLPFADLQAPDQSHELPAETGRLNQVWCGQGDQPVPVEFDVTPLQDPDEDVGYLLISVVREERGLPGGRRRGDPASLRDQLSVAKRKIEDLQRTDPVTGLATRPAFEETLERDWAIARREQNRVTVITFAIDSFVEYQALFGRHATDALLRKVGHAIGGTLRRAGDLGGRIDENLYAVLIGNADEQQARSCAERIAAKVRNLSIHHPRSTQGRFATVSFGVATEVPAWTQQSVDLIEQAQARLDAGSSRQLEAPVMNVLRQPVETESND